MERTRGTRSPSSARAARRRQAVVPQAGRARAGRHRWRRPGQLQLPHPPGGRRRGFGGLDQREDVAESLHAEPVEGRVRRPGVDDVPARADQHQRVADVHVGDRVGGEHDRPALVREQPQQQHHPLVEARVEAGGGLVEEDDLRLAQQFAGDRHALALAAAERLDQLAALVGQAQQREHVADPRVPGSAAGVSDPAAAGPGSRAPPGRSGRRARCPLAARSPSAARRPGGTAPGRRRCTRTVPAAAGCWPESSRISVVLPAPLGPATAVMRGRRAGAAGRRCSSVRVAGWRACRPRHRPGRRAPRCRPRPPARAAQAPARRSARCTGRPGGCRRARPATVPRTRWPFEVGAGRGAAVLQPEQAGRVPADRDVPWLDQRVVQPHLAPWVRCRSGRSRPAPAAQRAAPGRPEPAGRLAAP